MRADLMQQIEVARTHVRCDWDDHRAARVGRLLATRKRRRAMLRAAALSTAMFAVLAVVAASVWRWIPHAEPYPALTASVASSPNVLHISDGSVVSLVDEHAIVRPLSTSTNHVVVEVVSGGAHFDVASNPGRLFRVEVGRVAVEVIGTSFRVDRGNDSARVAVQRGRVRVSWDGQSAVLGAGEEGVFPRQSPAGAPTSSDSVPIPEIHPPAPLTTRPMPAPPPSAPQMSWRVLAEEGDYDKAWHALQQDGVDKVRDEPSELMQAADVARLSRHSAQATVPLRKLLENHPSDPRAPLAAFTLGRVLLDELGQPQDAARAFSQSRSLAPSGPMAEDALAREVEALSRAGDTVTARARAEEYVKTYPGGRREKSVRRHGGLE